MNTPAVERFAPSQTAEIIRKMLKRRFPGVDCWVRTSTYAGGASIDVYFDGTAGWETPTVCHCSDGPTGLQTPGDRCTVCGYIPTWQRITKPGAPTRKEVEQLTKGFGGKSFDGMIDLEYYIDSYLDNNGEVVGTRSSGTAGSGGGVPAWDGPIKTNRLVHFSADYISVHDEPPWDVQQKRGAKP